MCVCVKLNKNKDECLICGANLCIWRTNPKSCFMFSENVLCVQKKLKESGKDDSPDRQIHVQIHAVSYENKSHVCWTDLVGYVALLIPDVRQANTRPQN